MINNHKYFLFLSLSILLCQCNTPDDDSDEAIAKENSIDSLNDSWFSCYINQQKWEKTDSLTASFSVKSDVLFLNINSQYNSVEFKKIHLLIPFGDTIKSINKQLVDAVNDTLVALIIYSFAEIDYSSETPFPVNHMAFHLKPTALVSITKADTINNKISGTFKAAAEDERKRMYGFRNGIFQNVIYKKLKKIL